MFSGQHVSSISDSNDYDFDKQENAAKWKGVFITSLRKVLEQVHPSLSAREDALLYVESLCLRLLATLCAKPPPHTIQDIEERVSKTFPTPIDKWALKEARDIMDKSKKKNRFHPVIDTSLFPVDRVHSLLQKDVLQYKIDSTVSLFLVTVLEFISADILKLAGNYVKNIRHMEITKDDIAVAMCADKLLMDMFDQGHSDDGPDTPTPTPPSSMTYEEIVKQLIHDEKQYQRDLQMIIHVFREELVKIVRDPKELDPIFSNIIDIYEVTVTLLGSFEDVIEMSQDHAPPHVGSCFEEMAEAAEFDVYIRYARDVTSQESRDALASLMARPEANSLMSAGHGFREAVKFYLPKLLLAPIFHAFLYLDYVKELSVKSEQFEDRESFAQVQGLLKPLECELQNIVPLLPKDFVLRTHSNAMHRMRRKMAIEKIHELCSTVEHWDRDVGQSCNEFVREDKLSKVGSGGKRVTERKVYLFDGLLVLCKANTRRQTVGVGSSQQYDYRLKERYFMRKVEIVDRQDQDECRHLIEIAPRAQPSCVLMAKSAQHKIDWMADLVMVNTKSMLDRILDSILLDIEKKHPLRLPGAHLYKFSVPDSADNIVLEERLEATGVPLIKGATLLKLIERLTYHIYADMKFVHTFLTTYRSFCSPHELLQLLIERFNIPEPDVVYGAQQQQVGGGGGGSSCSSSSTNSVNSQSGGGRGASNNHQQQQQQQQHQSSSSSSSSNNNHHESSSLPSATACDTAKEQQQQQQQRQLSQSEKLHKCTLQEDLKRYRNAFMQPVQFRVVNVLRHWVNHHFYDFERVHEQDNELLKRLLEFLKSVNYNPMRKWIDPLFNTVQRKNEEAKKQITFDHQPPPIEHHLEVGGAAGGGFRGDFGDTLGITLLTVHPIELARQLTLFEFELYKNVRPSELVGSVWTKRDKERTSPNLLKIIKHTTNFTRWLERSIIECENFEERAASVQRAIEVMMVLMELNNFNGVLSVVSAMDGASVYRLKMTFQALPARHERFLEECREFHKDHFRKYQEKLRSINPPCVPFFGMYLTNILHIEEGNPDLLPNTDLINFSKRRRVAEITGEIQQYQNQPYCLTTDPAIRHFLEELEPFPGYTDTDISNHLYNESLRIEPRDCKQPLKFSRKWPELSLKSPGVKPKRQNNNNTSTLNSRSNHWPGSSSLSTSTTGELSPTASVSSSMSHVTHHGGGGGHHQHSQQDFSVFANVHIHNNNNNNSSSASSSQLSSSFNLSNADVSSMAGSTLHLQQQQQQNPPPELPLRSNSIISMPTMANSSGDRGAILSPNALNLKNQSPVVSPKVGNVSTPGYQHHHQHHMSADMIDFQAFYGGRDFGMTSSPQKTMASSMDDQQQPPLVLRSPPHRIGGGGGGGDQGGGAVPSPGLPMSFDFVPPISPHVNVPPKMMVLGHGGRYMHPQHQHMQMAPPPPPPLPPRVRRRDSSTSAAAAQHRQAPDAPQLPPRDISPPPLPPRTQGSGGGGGLGEGETEVHLRATDQLMLPNTSTIMLRRNSAAAQAAQQQQQQQQQGQVQTGVNGQGLTSSQSSFQLGQQKQQNSESGTGVQQQTMSSTRISNFRPGETTPRLPPKPKPSLSAVDRNTMFPYPATPSASTSSPSGVD